MKRQRWRLSRGLRVVGAFYALGVLWWWLRSSGSATNSEPQLAAAKRAWVTLADSDEYAQGALALAASLRRVRTAYPLWVLTTTASTNGGGGGLSRRTRAALANAGARVVQVAPVRVPSAVAPRAERWLRAFSKLRAFELPLETAVWVDCDAVAVRAGVDALFDVAPPPKSPPSSPLVAAAVEPRLDACFAAEQPQLNSGVLVLRPSAAAMRRLMATLEAMAADPANAAMNDQDVLARAFPAWTPLPYPRFGGHVVQCACPRFAEDTALLHFTAGVTPLPKPWARRALANLGVFSHQACIREWYDYWKQQL